MIPNKDLFQRAFLRDIDALDLPHETIQEWQDRIKSTRFNNLMKIRKNRSKDITAILDFAYPDNNLQEEYTNE